VIDPHDHGMCHEGPFQSAIPGKLIRKRTVRIKLTVSVWKFRISETIDTWES
jgi:hypothetical protein